MEKGTVLRSKFLVHQVIFALAQCPCKVFVKAVPHRSCVQEPDAAYSVVLLSALGNWKVLLAKLQVGVRAEACLITRMKACQFS